MTLKLQLIAVACSIGLIVLIFELVRRKQIKENYSLIWFFVAGGFLLMSAFGNHLDGIVNFLGFLQTSNAIIVYAIFLILILTLGLTVAVTRLSNLLQTLTQEMGLMKKSIEENNDQKGPNTGE